MHYYAAILGTVPIWCPTSSILFYNFSMACWDKCAVLMCEDGVVLRRLTGGMGWGGNALLSSVAWRSSSDILFRERGVECSTRLEPPSEWTVRAHWLPPVPLLYSSWTLHVYCLDERKEEVEITLTVFQGHFLNLFTIQKEDKPLIRNAWSWLSPLTEYYLVITSMT